ncbi:MAG: hypothetical protein H6529_07170 [Nocardioides sp.]|nr:hypothetical protein [Nocardioidaceae bacterium]MCB8956249.1 hypothetical protein [Nocardioides sp.]
MTGTRVVIAAGALTLLLGAAACSSDDPEPRVAPPSSSPPTTTPASSPTAPTMPPEARGTDAAAAEAFVKFFFEVVNFAQRTGDVSVLKTLGFRCGGCDAGVDSISSTYSHHGHIEGGEGRPAGLETGFLQRASGDWAVVECTVVTSKQFVDQPGKDNDKRYPAGKTDVRLILQPRSDAWVVRSLVTR